MYRLFVLSLIFADSTLVLGALCQGNTDKYCRPSSPRKYGPPHISYHSNGHGTATESTPGPGIEPTTAASAVSFEELAHNLITAELAIQKHCFDNSIANIKELYNSKYNYYILKYTLSDGEENDVSVKIKHKVIQVSVKKFGVVTFKDVRILPSIVDTQKASWTLANGNLEIYIPYIVNNKAPEYQCQVIDDAIIIVTKGIFTYREGNVRIQENQETNSGATMFIPQTDANTPLTNAPGTGKAYDTQDANVPSLDDVVASIFGPSDGQELIDIRNRAV